MGGTKQAKWVNYDKADVAGEYKKERSVSIFGNGQGLKRILNQRM